MSYQNIQSIRQHMNACRQELTRMRTLTKEYHAFGLYKCWAHCMNQCKRLKADLEILAHELHWLLYLWGYTRVAVTNQVHSNNHLAARDRILIEGRYSKS